MMKNWYLFFLFILANSALFAQYVIKISTSKKIYQYKEPIYINLSIENLSSLGYGLKFTSTCQASYEIMGVYNSLNNPACHDTSGFIPGTYSWQFLYNNSVLPVGYYKIVGKVSGYGKPDTSEFKVIDTLSAEYVASYSAILEDSAKGYSLSNVLVSVEGLDSTYSSLNGRFLFEFPASAFSDSEIIHPLFKFQSPYTREYSKRITINKGDKITGPDILLPFQFTRFTVAGHIYYGNKETKPSASLYFYGINVDYGGRYYPDTSGDYSVQLIPGSYYVNCGINYNINGFITVRDRYYNNTPDFNKKEILTVNKDTSGINFTFPTLQMGTISGNVSDSLTKFPLSNAFFVITPALPITDSVFALSNQKGDYSIQVLEDSYIMSVSKPEYHPEFYNNRITSYWWPDNFWYGQPAVVDTIVVDSTHLNYTGINFHLIPDNYEIGGFVKDRSSGKVLQRIWTYLVPVRHVPVEGGISDTNGYYFMSNGGYPGTYFILFNKDGYIDKYYNADKWEDATPFSVNDTSLVPTEIDAYLTPTDTSGGTISGNILLGSDSLLSYALVSAINSSDSVVSASISNYYGSYTLNSLPDGEYTIQASRVGYNTSQYPSKIKIDSKSQPSDSGINIEITITGIEDTVNTIPTSYGLFQNYPNPFNPSTTINYSIPKASFITIKIYDLLGREVKTLISRNETTGSYSINFNASNLSSGIYFYQLKAGDYIQTRKMVFLK